MSFFGIYPDLQRESHRKIFVFEELKLAEMLNPNLGFSSLGAQVAPSGLRIGK